MTFFWLFPAVFFSFSLGTGAPNKRTAANGAGQVSVPEFIFAFFAIPWFMLPIFMTSYGVRAVFSFTLLFVKLCLAFFTILWRMVPILMMTDDIRAISALALLFMPFGVICFLAFFAKPRGSIPILMNINCVSTFCCGLFAPL